jgi:hypothetical protein
MTIKRQDIMDAVKTRAQGILTTSGYHTNLGSNVLTGRPRQIMADGSMGPSMVDPSECPCIVLRDPTDELRASTLKRHAHRLTAEAEIRCEEGSTTDTEMRQMIADFYKAVGVDPKWGGLAVSTEPGSDESVLLQGEKIIGAALIRFFINFETDPWSES